MSSITPPRDTGNIPPCRILPVLPGTTPFPGVLQIVTVLINGFFSSGFSASVETLSSSSQEGHPMKRAIAIAAAIAGVGVLGLQVPAEASSVDPPGCTSGVIYTGSSTSLFAWARCNTSAPGNYFRAVLSCRERSGSGTYDWYNAYGPWVWQGATAESRGHCGTADIMGVRAEVGS